ncbi:hypothetical protein Droror1_Dr00022158 [Drosera rotundifolia]
MRNRIRKHESDGTLWIQWLKSFIWKRRCYFVTIQGKKATAFPAMCSKLSDQSEIESRVVVDGNLITSRGPGTAMEFSLAIVEKFLGREKPIEIAKTMLFVHP